MKHAAVSLMLLGAILAGCGDGLLSGDGGSSSDHRGASRDTGAGLDGVTPVGDGSKPVVDGPRPVVDAPKTTADAPLPKSDRSISPDEGTPPDEGVPPDRGLPQVDGPGPTSKACVSAGGNAQVAKPVLWRSFFDRWHEGWLASPAVADLDGDGKTELIVAREELLLVWNSDGTLKFKKTVSGRIWSSPVVADLIPAHKGLEVAVAARGRIYAWNASGAALPGFPVTIRDELRSIAAGDIDGDGRLELVVVTHNRLSAAGTRDIVWAVEANGTVVSGFPPNTTGSSGCDSTCAITGGYDQNLALGDITGDGKEEIFATQDNAYLSLHRGDGRAFDAASIFRGKSKWPGIRFMVDYALAQQGYSDNEAQDNQAHFTNSAPAIADIDGDGKAELVVLGSMQNALQTDRKRGVVLFVLHSDGTRPAAWVKPHVVGSYLGGLWDFDGTNVVAATNQVSVADVDGSQKGLEMVFAGFDGQIHCVSADNRSLWSTRYTSDARVLTGGVAIADLSGDGRPEIIFASYSPDASKSHLFIYDSAGVQLHRLPLPGRGAMAVPTIADLDGDDQPEIVVALKDAEDKKQMVMVFSVSGAKENCLLWPTGRGGNRRTGRGGPNG